MNCIFLSKDILKRRSGYSERVLSSFRAISAGLERGKDTLRLVTIEAEPSTVVDGLVPDKSDLIQLVCRNFRLYYNFQDIIALVKLFKYLRTNKTDLIHAHGVDCGFLAILLKLFFNFKVIVDIHGAPSAEFLYWWGKKKRLQYGLTRFKESICCRYADELFVVSYALKDYISKQYSAGATMTVINCAVDTAIFRKLNVVPGEQRKLLGLPEKGLIFIYSGSSQKWQMLPETVKLFKTARSRSRDAFFVACLNSGKTDLEKIFESNGIDRDCYLIVEKLSKQELVRYLNASDIGIIIRDSSIVNLVAFPTKFLEYLAAGLPVIVTDGLGDPSRIVIENGLGLVLAVSNLTNNSYLKREFDSFFNKLAQPFYLTAVKERCVSYASANTWKLFSIRCIERYKAVLDT